jgi:2,3-dihydroxybenzoate decarboxylase
MSDKGIRVIATEEGFSIPELGQASRKYIMEHDDEPALLDRRGGSNRPSLSDGWIRKLMDLGEERLRDMDAAGIDAAVLLVSSPGVQIFDPVQGTELARLVNDRAAAAMRAKPNRFYPLAALAPQDPDGAARELERAVKSLGLKGGIINSSTKGGYLDERKFWPILEAAEALDVPLYIHPREPSPAMLGPFTTYHLAGAIWGYAAETGLHGVRLIFSGAFDQFPKLKVVLGHCGEGLPFFMDRLDVRYFAEAMQRPKLKRRPSDYVRDNIVVTSSGMNWAPAVRLCQEVLGFENVLFAADYPFEDAVDAVQRAKAFALDGQQQALFLGSNAMRIFKI